LTLAPFAVIIFLKRTTNFSLRKKQDIFILLVALFFPLLNAYQIIDSHEKSVEFIRTYLLWVFNATAFWVILRCVIIKKTDTVANGAFIALTILTFFVMAQAGLVYLSGSTILYNIFGGHQYMGEVNIHKHYLGEINRAPGLYLEPSFCAFVIITLWTVCLISSHRIIASSMLSMVAMIFIVSFSGVLAFACLLALFLVMRDRYADKKLRNFSVFMAFSTLGLIVKFGDYLSGRALEIMIEGSSVYYRLVAPLVVIKDVLTNHPMGIAFGQMESYLAPFELIHGKIGGPGGSSIDNGVYLFLFYFGWLALILLTVFIISMLKAAISKKKNLSILLFYIFLSFGFSGGMLLPEYALLLIIVIYQYRIISQAVVLPNLRMHYNTTINS